MTDKGKEQRKRHLAPVYQSNPLLQARKHYGIMEHRLLRLAISDVRPQLKNSTFYDTEFRPFHLTTKDLLSMFQEGAGADDHRIYEKLRAAYRNMVKSYVEIGNASGRDVEVIPVFESIKFTVKGGLYITFNRAMMPYLIRLDGGCYTKTLLGMAFCLSSTYSLILLELMLQYQGRAKDGIIAREITLEELRFSMDVPEKAYEGRMNNFRRYVVDAAISDINGNTDYRIDPDYTLTRGRYNRVTGFCFTLHLPTPRPIPQDTDANAVPSPADIVDRLKNYGVNAKAARQLATLPNAEKSLEIALKYVNQGKAKNPAAYIRAAIEQDWQGQHEALKRAIERERKAAKDKRDWDRQAKEFFGVVRKKAADEPPPPPPSTETLEQIIQENPDTAFARIAKRILDKRKEQA